MRKYFILSFGDVKNISRDPILLISVFAPFILALVMRYGLPFVSGILLEEISFDLSQYYDLIMSILILITPMMMGMLSGFLILDERDENILTFYSVTPLSKSGYLFYRVAMPTIISFILSFFVFYFIGITECRIELLIPVLLLCSLESPMMALFLAAFASNKVEGLALSKAFGILFLAPAAGYFIESNWQYTAGIAPTFWVSKSLLAAVEMSDNYWIFIAVGLVAHLFINALLIKRFEDIYI
jgi:fluoroquinolone transport system permease protein